MGTTAKHMKIQRELDNGTRVSVRVDYKYAVTKEHYEKHGMYDGVELPAMINTPTVVQDAIDLITKLHKTYYKFEITRAGIWVGGNFEYKWNDATNRMDMVWKEGYYA